jgi:hypothetical protein
LRYAVPCGGNKNSADDAESDRAEMVERSGHHASRIERVPLEVVRDSVRSAK